MIPLLSEPPQLYVIILYRKLIYHHIKKVIDMMEMINVIRNCIFIQMLL